VWTDGRRALRRRARLGNLTHHPQSGATMVRTAVRVGGVAALAALLLAAPRLGAQAASPTPAPPAGPAVGDPAPDFSLTAATRYGLLREPVRLSDLRGQTVVLAFFYKARTKG
jgi:hypothetical protein